MLDDISEREGEIWGPETYYFYCPVCDKAYSIRYDASGRKSYDGRYEDYTCFIREGKCQFCDTDLYVAYDADHLRIVAYDIAEEEHRRKSMNNYDKKRRKLKKLKQLIKEEPTAELKNRRDTLKQKLKRMEEKIIARDEEYLEDCHRLMMARRQEESLTF